MDKDTAKKISELVAKIAFSEAAKVTNIGWGESGKAADAQKLSSQTQQELADLLQEITKEK